MLRSVPEAMKNDYRVHRQTRTLEIVAIEVFVALRVFRL